MRIGYKMGDDDVLSDEIVRYRGLALGCLGEVFEELDQVEVFELLEDFGGVPASRSVEVVEDDGNGCTVRVPFRKEPLEVEWRLLRKKAPEEWTLEDVCEFYVLPRTLATRSFFLDLVDGKQVGKPFQGVFISYARQSNFKEMLDALNSKFHENTFLWIDIFCANQPLLARMEHDLAEKEKIQRWDKLTMGLHLAIEKFDERTIFLDDFQDPKPLRRAWCVWEIYGIAKCGQNLDIMLGSQGVSGVVEMLENGDNFVNILANVDPRNMECLNENDLRFIRSAIEGLDGGFSLLKQIVTEKLNMWLSQTIEDHLATRTHLQDADTGELFLFAGDFMADTGKPDVAMRFYEQSRDIHEKLGNEERIGDILNNFGNMHFDKKEYDQALQCFEKSLRILSEIRGENDPSIGEILNNMGNVYDCQGDFTKALEFYQEALVKKDNIGSIADTLSNLALVHLKIFYLQEALEHANQALSFYKIACGERHPNVANALNQIGETLRWEMKYQDALAAFQESLDILKEVYGGENHPKVAGTFDDIGMIHRLMGNLDQANEAMEKSLAIKKMVYGDVPHPSFALSFMNLGLIAYDQKRFQDALHLYEQALSYDKESEAVILVNKGSAHFRLHDLNQAMACFERALSLSSNRQIGGETESQANIGIALVYHKQNQKDKSLEHGTKALAQRREMFGNKHLLVAEVLDTLSLMYRENGETKLANQCAQECSQIRRQEPLGGRNKRRFFCMF